MSDPPKSRSRIVKADTAEDARAVIEELRYQQQSQEGGPTIPGKAPYIGLIFNAEPVEA